MCCVRARTTDPGGPTGNGAECWPQLAHAQPYGVTAVGNVECDRVLCSRISGQYTVNPYIGLSHITTHAHRPRANDHSRTTRAHTHPLYCTHVRLDLLENQLTSLAAHPTRPLPTHARDAGPTDTGRSELGPPCPHALASGMAAEGGRESCREERRTRPPTKPLPPPPPPPPWARPSWAGA